MEATFGARVRAMRLEAGYRTQDDLATALTEHGFDASRRWVTGIENNEFEPNIAGLLALQKLLSVDVRFLLLGEQPGESEFLATIRGLEERLDARGKRSVVRMARAEAAEAEEQEFEGVRDRLLAEGADRQSIALAERRARQILAGSTPPPPAAGPRPRRRADRE